MNTKHNMKRISISIIAVMLLLGFLSGCGKKENAAAPKSFVERIQPLNEALLPLLDSYTSASSPLVTLLWSGLRTRRR